MVGLMKSFYCWICKTAGVLAPKAVGMEVCIWYLSWCIWDSVFGIWAGIFGIWTGVFVKAGKKFLLDLQTSSIQEKHQQ